MLFLFLNLFYFVFYGGREVKKKVSDFHSASQLHILVAAISIMVHNKGSEARAHREEIKAFQQKSCLILSVCSVCLVAHASFIACRRVKWRGRWMK